MNIVVLCGGLSNERDVSISSGSGVARALRERGHKAVLVDVFFGYQGQYSDPHEIFDMEQPALGGAVGEREPDLEAVRRSRRQAPHGSRRPGGRQGQYRRKGRSRP